MLARHANHNPILQCFKLKEMHAW